MAPLARSKRINKLAAANQAARDLANEIHVLKQRQAPLEHELRVTKDLVGALKREREADGAELAKHRDRKRLSDAELHALSAIVITESTEATPARRMLQSELRLRGLEVDGKAVPFVFDDGTIELSNCAHCGIAFSLGDKFGLLGGLALHKRCMP